jgi:hypothetical protein
MKNGRGVESYDREKAWPSTNHSILSAKVGEQEGGEGPWKPLYILFIDDITVLYRLRPSADITLYNERRGAMITITSFHTRHSHVVCNRQNPYNRQSYSGGLGFHSIAVFRGMNERKRAYKVQHKNTEKELAGWAGKSCLLLFIK